MEENKQQDAPQEEAPKKEEAQKEEAKNQEQPEQKPAGEDADIKENKVWALLSYLGILCLIPLLAKKDSKFAQFHAKQGLLLVIGWVVSWFPILGWIIGIIVLVLSIIGIVNVLSGEMKKLPLIGDYAEKLNI
jgi:uncharacterized membrane protein